MKQAVWVLVGAVLIVGLMVWGVPALVAAEHGGTTLNEHGGTAMHEHAGDDHAAVTEEADMPEMTSEDDDIAVLLQAADELEAKNPDLAAKVRTIAREY